MCKRQWIELCAISKKGDREYELVTVGRKQAKCLTITFRCDSAITCVAIIIKVIRNKNRICGDKHEAISNQASLAKASIKEKFCGVSCQTLTINPLLFLFEFPFLRRMYHM